MENGSGPLLAIFGLYSTLWRRFGRKQQSHFRKNTYGALPYPNALPRDFQLYFNPYDCLLNGERLRPSFGNIRSILNTLETIWKETAVPFRKNTYGALPYPNVLLRDFQL